MWNPVWTWTTTTYTFDFETLFCGVFFHFGRIAIFLNILSLFFKDFSTKISSSTATVDCIRFFSNFGIHWTTKPTYCASTSSSKCKCCHKSRFSNIFFPIFFFCKEFRILFGGWHHAFPICCSLTESHSECWKFPKSAILIFYIEIG